MPGRRWRSDRISPGSRPAAGARGPHRMPAGPARVVAALRAQVAPPDPSLIPAGVEQPATPLTVAATGSRPGLQPQFNRFRPDSATLLKVGPFLVISRRALLVCDLP